MLLIISGIVAIIGFILWMFGLALKNQNLIVVGVVPLVLAVIFGFGLFGGAVPSGKATTEIIIPENVAKSEFVVFVKIDNQTISSSDAKIVSLPVDKLRVKKINRNNAYGGCINSTYEIVTE